MGLKPQSHKSMLHLISTGLPKLKVKYVLKYFDQDFNHPLLAKEFSPLSLNEKGFKKKKKGKHGNQKSCPLSCLKFDY